MAAHAHAGVTPLLLGAPQASYAVTIHVRNSLNAPVSGAVVWIGIDSATNVLADAGGNAVITLTRADNYLIVARHPTLGRAQPLYPYVNRDTNFTITLPPLTALRVASYNFSGMSAMPASQVTALARILWTVQPDLLLAQETRTASVALSSFTTQFLAGYTNVQSYVGGTIRNAVVSHYPITKRISAGAQVMTRDLFGAEVDVPVLGKTTVMSVHYKAYKGAAEATIRDNEATFTATYCSNLHRQAALYIVAGDMNEDADDPTWLSHVHRILTNYSSGLQRLEPRDDTGDPATYPFYSSRLDYIYVCNGFSEHIQTSRVFRTDTMMGRPAWLASATSGAASDHVLVYADITLVPEPWGALLSAGALVFVRWRRCVNAQRYGSGCALAKTSIQE
jgi:endonuclease/exonuclease/phosphatase family metal-dependent hydrolase